MGDTPRLQPRLAGYLLALDASLDADNVVVNRPALEAGLTVLYAGGDFADGLFAYEGDLLKKCPSWPSALLSSVVTWRSNRICLDLLRDLPSCARLKPDVRFL